MTKKILLLPGDGIGIEVCKEVKKIISWINKNFSKKYELEEGLIGGSSYDEYGSPLSNSTLDLAKKADAILLGAVGGDKWKDVERKKRPEMGLLKLRKELDLFANLRPAITFDALINSSSLKEDVIKDLDILIVRELTSGVYFGEPRGIEEYNGIKRCVDTQSYTEEEINRVAKIAFEIAEKRDNKIHSVEKSNVMETGIFWKNIVSKLHEKKYKNVNLNHMYADNCAMQLVKYPKQFDVILTDNLFGDILSDISAMCTGSLGMLPSASLGFDNSGNKIGLYEPVHGSAPDIAGKDLANPCAAILSFAMMLEISFEEKKLAKIIKNAIENVLEKGIRTFDIQGKEKNYVSTSIMGDQIIKELAKLCQ